MKKYFALLGLVVLLAGCVGLSSAKKHTSSSLVDYLYPDNNRVVKEAEMTHLSLPIDIGIAFVPNNTYSKYDLSEADKVALLEKVTKEFKEQKFIRNIEVIPSNYLKKKGGFDNLQQIGTMYGVDVIALVSHDQVQHTDANLLSLTYWTIVGAYIFPGEKNDTSTMLDIAVFDIASQKMLFRAPGVSNVKALSSELTMSETLRKNAKEGFELAADEMITNLKLALENFKKKVKNTPKEYKVTNKPGYHGGAFGFIELCAVLLLGAVCLRKKQSA